MIIDEASSYTPNCVPPSTGVSFIAQVGDRRPHRRQRLILLPAIEPELC